MLTRRLALALVRGYQLMLAPFSGGACRFEPSCSAYALEAIEIHGVVRGGWLAVRRLTRCHPWSPPGIDPVPPPTSSGRRLRSSARSGRPEPVQGPGPAHPRSPGRRLAAGKVTTRV